MVLPPTCIGGGGGGGGWVVGFELDEAIADLIGYHDGHVLVSGQVSKQLSEFGQLGGSVGKIHGYSGAVFGSVIGGDRV